MQASVLTPPMFMAQEPQIPSRQERLNVNVESSWFLILIKASKTIGPQLWEWRWLYLIWHHQNIFNTYEFKSILYSCIFGLISGVPGFHLYTCTDLILGVLSWATPSLDAKAVEMWICLICYKKNNIVKYKQNISFDIWIWQQWLKVH